MLFRPVRIDGQVMVDGGVINPLPFDLIADDCDIVIAVDVVGGPVDRARAMPGSLEAIYGSDPTADAVDHGGEDALGRARPTSLSARRSRRASSNS